MTVLARPAPLVEANQSDHNSCGPMALTACLDALGLPTNWTDMRAAAGGDASGTFASQLVTAAKSRDPSVVAFATVDDPTLVVDKWIPQGRYVLLAGQCYGSAEPAPLGSTTIEHWYIVYGTGWECCNIWGGTYPTYPNLPASYVKRLGCVVLGRSAPVPPVKPQPPTPVVGIGAQEETVIELTRQDGVTRDLFDVDTTGTGWHTVTTRKAGVDTIVNNDKLAGAWLRFLSAVWNPDESILTVTGRAITGGATFTLTWQHGSGKTPAGWGVPLKQP